MVNELLLYTDWVGGEKPTNNQEENYNAHQVLGLFPRQTWSMHSVRPAHLFFLGLSRVHSSPSIEAFFATIESHSANLAENMSSMKPWLNLYSNLYFSHLDGLVLRHPCISA